MSSLVMSLENTILFDHRPASSRIDFGLIYVLNSCINVITGMPLLLKGLIALFDTIE